MKRDGLASPGELWATRCECIPILEENRYHNVFKYILDHEKKGAAVWSFPSITMADFNPDDLRVD